MKEITTIESVHIDLSTFLHNLEKDNGENPNCYDETGVNRHKFNKALKNIVIINSENIGDIKIIYKKIVSDK